MSYTNSITMLTETTSISNKWMRYDGHKVRSDKSILDPTNVGKRAITLFNEEIVVMVREFCHDYDTILPNGWGAIVEHETHERITLAPEQTWREWKFEEWGDGEEPDFGLLRSTLLGDFKMTINSPRIDDIGEYLFGGFEFEGILKFFVEGFANEVFDLYDDTDKWDQNPSLNYIFIFTFHDNTRRFFNISGEEISLETAKEVLGWK